MQCDKFEVSLYSKSSDNNRIPTGYLDPRIISKSPNNPRNTDIL